jgi:hypothetical protein
MLVLMVQVNKFKWRIESPMGFIITDDIIVENKILAEDFVRAWASSFVGWNYKVIPLEEK